MENITVPILILSVSIGLFVYGAQPQYEKTKVLLEKKAEYDNALDKAKDLIVSRDAVLSKYNSFSPNDLSSLDKLLPDNADNVRLLMDISGIASRYGMILKNVSIEMVQKTNASTDNNDISKNVVIAEAGEKKYGAVNIKFSVTTSYENFVSFIRDLEENRRISDVYNISFKSTETGEYQYSLGLRIYWLK